jgi:hypothetical protein
MRFGLSLLLSSRSGNRISNHGVLQRFRSEQGSSPRCCTTPLTITITISVIFVAFTHAGSRLSRSSMSFDSGSGHHQSHIGTDSRSASVSEPSCTVFDTV